LYCGLGGSGGIGGGATAACSTTAAGTSVTGAGANEIGAATGFSVALGLTAGRRVLLLAVARVGFSVGRAMAETDVDSACADDVTVDVAASPGGIAGVDMFCGPLVAEAGITGRRAAACTANRSAADFVRRYPAVYTASTAAELSATRLFDTFLWEPLSDTRGNYKKGNRQKGKGKSEAKGAKARLSFG